MDRWQLQRMWLCRVIMMEEDAAGRRRRGRRLLDHTALLGCSCSCDNCCCCCCRLALADVQHDLLCLLLVLVENLDQHGMRSIMAEETFADDDQRRVDVDGKHRHRVIVLVQADCSGIAMHALRISAPLPRIGRTNFASPLATLVKMLANFGVGESTLRSVMDAQARRAVAAAGVGHASHGRDAAGQQGRRVPTQPRERRQRGPRSATRLNIVNEPDRVKLDEHSYSRYNRAKNTVARKSTPPVDLEILRMREELTRMQNDHKAERERMDKAHSTLRERWRRWRASERK